MRITLHPIDEPELAPLQIEDPIFTIGRLSPPFNTLAKFRVGDLSRNHAKLYEEQGCVYIQDLGSLNGTQLNGDILDQQPHPLRHGDSLCFAQCLSYQVTLEQDATLIEVQQPILSTRLILRPSEATSGLDTLIINQFPFLVGREGAVFGSLKASLRSRLKQVSRRHAYLFVTADGTLQLEDLNSSNGTYHNQQTIHTPVVLKNGDTVGFGGQLFSYTIEFEHTHPTTQDHTQVLPPPATLNTNSQETPSGTIFVEEASSFLDIFCGPTEMATSDPADSHHSQTDRPRPDSAAKPSGKKSKTHAFIQQMRTAFLDDAPPKHTTLYIGLIALTCIGVAFAAYHYYRGPEHEIRQLIKQGDWNQSLSVASTYLKTHPDHAPTRTLFRRALLNRIMADWLHALKRQQFAEANALVETTRADYPQLSAVDDTFPIMLWIGQLHRFLDNRSDDRLDLFRDMPSILSLTDWWNQHKQENQLGLASIARDAPEFADTYSYTLSQYRILQNERDTYSKPITELKQIVVNHLKSGQTDALAQALEEFGKKYSRISGVDALKADLEHYLQLTKQMNTHMQTSVIPDRSATQAEFATPWFTDLAQRLLREQRPPDPIIARIRQAGQAWQNGETERAIQTLQTLSEQGWTAFIAKRLEHYQDIAQKQLSLEQAKSTTDFPDHLLALASSLNLPEDQYFITAIDGDLKRYQQQAEAEAQKQLSLVRQAWQGYLKHGKINSLMRLETQLSDNFIAQAKRLSRAADPIQPVTQLYKNLNQALPAEWVELFTSIQSEISRQRKWLSELELILPPGLLAQKLSLLNTAATEPLS